MAAPRLRVLGTVPGAHGLNQLLSDFGAAGGGLVTAFSDSTLRVCARFASEHEKLETISFGELIRRSLTLCGEHPSAIASGSQVTAAIGALAQEFEPNSPFAASARFAGFHKAAARTIKELAAWGVGAEELREAASRMSGASAEKVSALAGLRAGLDDTLSALGRDLVDSQLLRSLECKIAPECSLGRIFLAAGSEYEPVRARWCRWAVEQGAELWIVTDEPVEGAKLFQGAEFLAQQLRTSRQDHVRPSGLGAALFTSDTAVGGVPVRITSSADAFAECEWTLRDCLKEIEAGTSPNEIAIFVRSLDEYSPLLTVASNRLGVPIRMAMRSSVLTNRFAQHLLDLLRFCADDDARLLKPNLRSSYFDLPNTDQKELGAFLVQAYKARKNQWPVLRGWAEANEDKVPWLPKLLDWRLEAHKEDRSLYEWIQRLGVLGDLLLAGVGPGLPTMPRDSRILTALRRPLASIASVRRVTEDRPMSLTSFVRVCEEAWKGEEYTIPASESGIEVVSNAQSIGAVKSLHVMGMLEGVFPRRRGEDAILTDEERALISQALSLEPPLPDSYTSARQERDEFYRLCVAPTERLSFSYPQTDENRDNVPAFYLHEVERASTRVERHDHPRVPFSPKAEDALAEADRQLAHARAAERVEALPVQFSTLEGARSVAWDEHDPLSPQDLREIARCEFLHFARRRLDLKPSRNAGRWANLRKLPQTARLLEQPNAIQARKAMEIALEAELEDLYGELPEWEMALLKSGGKRLIDDWLKREFKAREIWPRQHLQPDSYFGRDGLRDKMPGGTTLKGSVAGVSRIGPYSVAHVYEVQPPKVESRLGGPLEEIDTLYYGLHLLARYTDGPTAIEVESLNGNRTLVLMPRMPEEPLSSRRQDNLEVIDLAGGNEPGVAKKAFYDEVKRRLRKAVARLKEGGIEPVPGEHCSWCGFGELCRRAQGYGEEDSPFGVDTDEFE